MVLKERTGEAPKTASQLLTCIIPGYRGQWMSFEGPLLKSPNKGMELTSHRRPTMGSIARSFMLFLCTPKLGRSGASP